MTEPKKIKSPKEAELLAYYANKFQRLRVDRAHGIAPHKPILLLSVIELIQKESIRENRIYLSQGLIRTFLKYWSYLGSASHHPDIFRPFFHMRSGKFWYLWANPGFEKVISSKVKLKTFAEVQEAVQFAYLDEDLFEFLQDSLCREILINILVARWFSGRLELVKNIPQTDCFQNPPMYFQDSIHKYSRLKELSL